ncbi:hypothetical protein [Bacillus anthracis]|uniref:hypothetical protein n=1 Tax=Bacillus anthracis TaxID=1392 RepID=UPI0039A5EF32
MLTSVAPSAGVAMPPLAPVATKAVNDVLPGFANLTNTSAVLGEVPTSWERVIGKICCSTTMSPLTALIAMNSLPSNGDITPDSNLFMFSDTLVNAPANP